MEEAEHKSKKNQQFFLHHFSHTWLKTEPIRRKIKTHYYTLQIILQLVWKDIKNHI